MFNKLMTKMRGVLRTNPQSHPQRRHDDTGQQKAQLPRINLTPYKLATRGGTQLCPCRQLPLVEKRIIDSTNTMQNKRAACIAMMLDRAVLVAAYS